MRTKTRYASPTSMTTKCHAKIRVIFHHCPITITEDNGRKEEEVRVSKKRVKRVYMGEQRERKERKQRGYHGEENKQDHEKLLRMP